MIEFCNPDCKYLIRTQRKVPYKLCFPFSNKPVHFCKKYNVCIMHRGHYPNLIKHEECNEED
jgi:hypothetical protein